MKITHQFTPDIQAAHIDDVAALIEKYDLPMFEYVQLQNDRMLAVHWVYTIFDGKTIGACE